MFQINQLAMSFGEKLLFCDVNLTLNPNLHYALIGANGTGKSTFFKILSRAEEPDAGTITIPKSTTIGWLKQDQFRYENTLIADVVLQGKSALWAALKGKDELLASGDWNDKMAHDLSAFEEIINHENGYSALALVERLLLGLGIRAEYHQQPLSALSGGYKLRVLLAQTLFKEPNILLLDEPTNHLDIVSIDWLEKYLKNEFKGLVIFITHDVRFINSLADYILDVDYGEIRQYSGRYDKFLEEKHLLEEQKLTSIKHIEKKIAEMQSFVDRFGSKASKATQARSRVKMIAKLEIPDVKNSSRRCPVYHFQCSNPSSKIVLEVKGLEKKYDDKILFKSLNFKVNRGEKIAILGENGVGKSTLLKVLLGLTPQDLGEYTWGGQTHISYFSQDFHELLKGNMNVLEWISEQVPTANEQQIRKTLGQMLFPKDDITKNIQALSGGEAARLLISKNILDKSNVLIFDEPTNHLDLESIESLGSALHKYTGTVIFVSHNRDFVNQIANRILFLSHQKPFKDYRGSYFEFEKQLET